MTEAHNSLANIESDPLPRWMIGVSLLSTIMAWVVMNGPPELAVPATASAGWEFAPVAKVLSRIDPQFARGMLAGLFAMQVAIYALTLLSIARRKLQVRLRTVVLATVLIAIPMLALPRMLSSDVYLYAMYGRMIGVHGQNPFFHVPTEMTGDSLLPYVLWSNLKSVYGPIWLIACVPTTWLALALGGSAAANVLAFKIGGLGFHLINIFLIDRILRAIRPEARTWGTIFYAWNPFALMELVGSAHNDSLMITCILLGCLMEVRGRRMMALIAFVCAGLVKVPGGLLVPAYALYVAWSETARSEGGADWGKMVTSVARQAAVGIAVVAVLYAPFWRGSATLKHLSGGPNFNKLLNSPAARAYWVLEGRLHNGEPRPAADTIDPVIRQPDLGARREQLAANVRKGSLGLFGIVLLGLSFYPMRTRQAFFQRAVWILAAYCLIAAYDFHPWYILWVTALMPLLGRARVLLSAATCAVFVLYFPWHSNEMVSMAFLPLAGAMVWQVGRDGKKDRVEVEEREVSGRVVVGTH